MNLLKKKTDPQKAGNPRQAVGNPGKNKRPPLEKAASGDETAPQYLITKTTTLARAESASLVLCQYASLAQADKVFCSYMSESVKLRIAVSSIPF